MGCGVLLVAAASLRSRCYLWNDDDEQGMTTHAISTSPLGLAWLLAPDNAALEDPSYALDYAWMIPACLESR